MATRSRPPPLTPETLAEEGMIALRIEELVHHDARAKRFSREIARAQGRLQELTGISDEAAWESFLDLEAMTNARSAHVLVLVATWAYSQGRSNQ